MKPPIQSNPMLRREHIANCRMFVDRIEMVQTLAPRQSVGAEVGVWNGDFSTQLIQLLEPTRLHLIDIEIRDQVHARFAQEIGGPRLALHQGDSSVILNGQFPDEYFDWIYIDGDHSYDGVKRDADVSIRKLKPEGMLFFNDYKMGDHNYPDGFYPYGVIAVVNDLCLNGGFEMIGFAFHSQMYCDVAIKRREP